MTTTTYIMTTTENANDYLAHVIRYHLAEAAGRNAIERAFPLTAAERRQVRAGNEVVYRAGNAAHAATTLAEWMQTTGGTPDAALVREWGDVMSAPLNPGRLIKWAAGAMDRARGAA